jgi:methylenetetrahydrofolate reductase (NADPH)
MRRIPEIYAGRQFALSIEIFPPKTPEGDAALFEHLGRLKAFDPAFVSCTYGAGGSTQTRTVELCQRIQAELQIPATAHFTCVGSTVEQLQEWLTGNTLLMWGSAWRVTPRSTPNARTRRPI